MEKNSKAKANVVGDTYKEIVNIPISKKDLQDSTDQVIEQANELINPEPNSMDSRG
ncbi:hypothetical protein FACS189423_06010 [Bacteroidia bacterium]|nr:hypothetical protein FACS189423_06010 [Bacteroidia bacterium]